jgi:hypothetical protein
LESNINPSIFKSGVGGRSIQNQIVDETYRSTYIDWSNPEDSVKNCNVTDAKCNSENYWKQLIKPYIEE